MTIHATTIPSTAEVDNETIDLNNVGKLRIKPTAIPLTPVYLNSGVNVFKDSSFTLGKVALRFPNIITGEVILATDNVARGKTPTSNTTITNPSNITDDNYTTAGGVPATAGNYILLDLGSSDTYLLDTMLDSNGFTTLVQISENGSSFTTVATLSAGLYRKYTGVHTFRYVRLYVSTTLSGANMWCWEISCYKSFTIQSNVKALTITPLTYAIKSIYVKVPTSTPAMLGTSVDFQG